MHNGAQDKVLHAVMAGAREFAQIMKASELDEVPVRRALHQLIRDGEVIAQDGIYTHRSHFLLGEYWKVNASVQHAEAP